MRKTLLTSIAMLPLLLSYSHAAQKWSADQSAPPVIFWSEDSTSGSYLGVDIADVTTDRLAALKLKEEKGVEVTMVDQDAPAGKAGIKEHDVILTMNGSAVESAAQLRRMIHETPAGRVVTFGLSRDGQPVTVKVQLGDRHNEFSFVAPKAKDFHIEIPEMHMPEIDMPAFNMVVVSSSARSGLTVENLTPQLGEFFGVKSGNGVLVRAVEKGSRADKAGFHAGDVIVKVNDQPVHDTSDFTHAVRSRNGSGGNGGFNVGVIREKKEQNLNLTLPERKESGDMLQDDSDESFDVEPLINAETALELSQVQDEVAEIRPQIELAVKEATENSRKAMQQVRKALCDEQKQVRQLTEKERVQLRKDQEKLKKELERMTREARRNWLEL
jgi:serine protease Do